MKHYWTKQELKDLNEWEELNNTVIPYEIGEDVENDRLLVYYEAKLLISNKYMIAYHDNDSIGIFTFRELIELVDRYNKHGIIVNYHPLNYNTTEEFVAATGSEKNQDDLTQNFFLGDDNIDRLNF